MRDRLYRKRGTWYGAIYLPGGKRKLVCTRCKDRRAARLALSRIEREIQAGRDVPTPEKELHTVEQALQYFVEQANADLSDATREMYACKAGHLNRLLGKRDLHLSIDEVQWYINTRLDEQAARSTVHKELVTLRQARKLARQRGLLDQDPRDCFPTFRIDYVPRKRWLTQDEFARLIKHLPEKRRLWIAVVAYLGVRYSEVGKLRWENYVEKWILVPGTKRRGAHRRIPVPRSFRPILNRVAAEAGPIVETWTNVHRDLKEACSALGIQPVTPNDLRRTFASWMLQRGVSNRLVAALLGHSTTRMVDLVYGQLGSEALEEAVNRLPKPKAGSKWVTEMSGGAAKEQRVLIKRGKLKTAEIVDFSAPARGLEPLTNGLTVRPAQRLRPRLRLVNPRSRGGG